MHYFVIVHHKESRCVLFNFLLQFDTFHNHLTKGQVYYVSACNSFLSHTLNNFPLSIRLLTKIITRYAIHISVTFGNSCRHWFLHFTIYYCLLILQLYILQALCIFEGYIFKFEAFNFILVHLAASVRFWGLYFQVWIKNQRAQVSIGLCGLSLCGLSGL